MRTNYDRQLKKLNDEMVEMGSMIEGVIEKAIKALVNQDVDLAQEVIRRDDQIDQQEKDIESLCFKLLLMEQPVATDLRQVSSALKMVTDMERIGDHAENFANYTKTEIKHNTGLTGDAKEEINKMYTAVSKLLKLSLECFMEQDGVNKPEEKLAEIAILEASIDKMERRYQKHHIKRLAKGECEPRAGLLFSDMLSELERIADHSVNIAYSMSDEDEDCLLYTSPSPRDRG